ncbi:ATP-binding protein [Bacillus subtilis]|uniref:NACHT domain-containing protein n=1 Tax=Bacillus sp. SG20033 TaxID=3366583 RepID=UPI0037C5C8AE
MIEWSKLKAYETDQKKSFEELCYQIARLEFDEKGTFTSVDDSGGGDGVEFYMTLPNGEQWGWQAKFYLDGPLSISSRKQSIKGSLEKAIKVHPDLKKWYLCIPQDLTVGEKKWFDTTLREVIPNGLKIDLDLWGKTEINHFMGDPKFLGRRNYFFGELELTFDWFNTQVLKQLSNLKGKYNPLVHTQTDVDFEISSLLLSDEYKKYLNENCESFVKEIKSIQSISNKELLHDFKSMIDLTYQFLGLLKEEISFLEGDSYSKKSSLPFNEVFERLQSCISDIQEKSNSENKAFLNISESEGADKYKFIVQNVIWRLLHNSKNIVDAINKSRSNHLYIFGDAGYGKTHVAAHVTSKTIENNLPAIFISGKNIVDSRVLTEQILAILDIPKNYSWSDFLKALDVAGKAFRTKIPIFIDGLNEVRDIDVVKNSLVGLVEEISNYENICIITTCRSTYIEPLFGKHPINSVHLIGFTNENLTEAVQTYFDYYKLKSDFSSVSLEVFRHPLYLQIFCQTKNPQRISNKHVFINEQSVFDIFDVYLKQCNKNISESLNLNPKSKLILNKLNNLGNTLWEQNTRFISIDHAEEILENNQAPKWNDSFQKNLIDENLLIYRDWNHGEDIEVITFTYDLLGGYVIAKYLLHKHENNMDSFFSDSDTIKRLFGDDKRNRHPLHEDISRCIAALLPVYQGKYIIDYIENKLTVNLTIKSLFEMSPEIINDKSKRLILNYFSKPSNRINFFSLAEKTFRHVRHPLNFHFWASLLNQLNMADRDVSWSEHLRTSQFNITDTFDVLESQSKKGIKNLDIYMIEYLNLSAEYTMWTLTSTVRHLRDKATRALYYFGRTFPKELFSLFLKSLNINDPYVSERMLAALYGVAMANQSDFHDDGFRLEILPELAKGLYKCMFAEDAEYFTTHILARDYGRRFIEIALVHNPTLLNEIEKENIKPPYTNRVKFNWGSIEEGKSIDSINPIRMDFGNYTIGRLIKNRPNYDYEHDDYKKVRAQISWRIYNLGYSSELFEDIDNAIENSNYRYDITEEGSKTDRYGKKYSWIAFFEMAGYRVDQGLLDNHWYLDNDRISELDIDPSFLDEIPNFRIVTKDYFFDNLPIEEWLADETSPDFNEYLIMDEINGENGPWVLLDGFFSDFNNDETRKCFFFPRGLLVTNKDFERITTLLKEQSLAGRWLPEIPHDQNLYAGEIPWADTFSENNYSLLEFEIKKNELIKTEEKVLLKDEKKLSPIEEREFIKRLCEEEKIGLLSYISYDIGGIDTLQEEEINFEEYGARIEKEIIEKNVVKLEKEDFQVLLPVREYNCDIDSEVISNHTELVPCKEIARAFQLVSQPQTLDLYEKNGKKASKTVSFRSSFNNRQKFTYLRMDLLNRFLEEKGYKLIWGLWGSKEISYKNEKDRQLLLNKNKKIDGNFQKILTYQEEIGSVKSL